MKVILFENHNAQNLYPITLTRPSFDIMCGGTTLYDLLKQEFKPVKMDFLVRKYLQNVAKQKFGPLRREASRPKTADTKILFLDGSVVPNIKIVQNIAKKIKSDKSIIFKNRTQIIGAYLDLKDLGLAIKDIDKVKLDRVVEFLKSLKLKAVNVKWDRFEELWNVIDFNEKILPDNLAHLSQTLKKIKPGVFVGKKVKIEDNAVFDSSEGLVVIGDGTWVKSFSILRGPLYIGKNCIVNSHSELKHNSCIGDVCKVGGEIEVSVFQGYSNKQHSGFLGSSYVGEWVNIGGGTSNSDLKNTYSSVKMLGQDTDKKFLGCIIGDYCKTALNVSIFTGKVIGVNALLYGTVTRDVPSFANAGTLMKKWITCPLDVAYKIQKTMFERRKKKATATDRRLLKDVFDMTKNQRKASKISTGKIEFIS